LDKKLAKHDEAIAVILSAIRHLMNLRHPSAARLASLPISAPRSSCNVDRSDAQGFGGEEMVAAAAMV